MLGQAAFQPRGRPVAQVLQRLQLPLQVGASAAIVVELGRDEVADPAAAAFPGDRGLAAVERLPAAAAAVGDGDGRLGDVDERGSRRRSRDARTCVRSPASTYSRRLVST